MGELFLPVPNAPDICQGEGKLELVRNLAVNILLEEGEQREVEPRPFGVLALKEGRGHNRLIKPNKGGNGSIEQHQGGNQSIQNQGAYRSIKTRQGGIDQSNQPLTIAQSNHTIDDRSTNPHHGGNRSIKPHQGGNRSIIRYK
jgi:hypothetical protein